MDELHASVVERLFMERGPALRVVFTDGESYDLEDFSVGQDDDEALPHATASIVKPLKQKWGRSRIFREGSVMFFSLGEVRAVHDVDTGAVLFELGAATDESGSADSR